MLPLQWEREFSKKEVIQKCWIDMVADRVVCLVCACWLPYCGLSLKSWQHLNWPKQNMTFLTGIYKSPCLRSEPWSSDIVQCICRSEGACYKLQGWELYTYWCKYTPVKFTECPKIYPVCPKALSLKKIFRKSEIVHVLAFVVCWRLLAQWTQ